MGVQIILRILYFFLRKVSRGSDGKYSSAQDTNLVESLDCEDGEIREDGRTVYGALAVGETKGTVSRDSSLQEHSDPDWTNTHGHTGSKYPEHSSTYIADAYEVMMQSIHPWT